MTDREKVIKGVTRCSERNWRNSCLDCPYENIYGDRIRCTGELSREVLALLKEQEDTIYALQVELADAKETIEAMDILNKLGAEHNNRE